VSECGPRERMWNEPPRVPLLLYAERFAADSAKEFRYTMGSKARYPSGKGEVCKTFIRGFDSHPRLHQILNKNDSPIDT
jgi:hypothetical protein